MKRDNARFLNLFILQLLAKNTEYKEEVEAIIDKYEMIVDLRSSTVVVDQYLHEQYTEEEESSAKALSVDCNINRVNKMLDNAVRDAVRFRHVDIREIVSIEYAIEGLIKMLIGNVSGEELIRELALNYRNLDRCKSGLLMYGYVLVKERQ